MNKQYTKEEAEALRDRVLKAAKEAQEYNEFSAMIEGSLDSRMKRYFYRKAKAKKHHHRKMKKKEYDFSKVKIIINS